MAVPHNVAARFFVALPARQLEQAGIDAGKLLFAVHMPDKDAARVGQPLAQLSPLRLARLLLPQHCRCFSQRQAPAMEKPEGIEDAPVGHINLGGADVPQRLREGVDGIRPGACRSVADQLNPVLVGDEQAPAADGRNGQRRRTDPDSAVDPAARFRDGGRGKKVRPRPQQHHVVHRAARAAGRQHLGPRNRRRDQSEPQRLPRPRAPQPGEQQQAHCRQPGNRRSAHGTYSAAHLHRPRLPARFGLCRRSTAAVLAHDVAEQAAAVQTAPQHVQFVPKVLEFPFGAEPEGRSRLPDIEP